MKLLRYQPSTRGCVVNLQYRLEGIAPSQAQCLFHHVLLVDCKCVGLRKPLSVHTAVGHLDTHLPRNSSARWQNRARAFATRTGLGSATSPMSRWRCRNRVLALTESPTTIHRHVTNSSNYTHFPSEPGARLTFPSTPFSALCLACVCRSALLAP